MTSTETIEGTRNEKHVQTGKQLVSVQIYDSSESMYFSTRVKITDTDVMQMRDIPGLTRVDAVPEQLWVHVSYGKAYSYQELVPQILLALADILGVLVSGLEFAKSDGSYSAGDIDITELIEEAKKLEINRRRTYVAQRIVWLSDWVVGMRRTIKDHLVERRQLLREQKQMGWS